MRYSTFTLVMTALLPRAAPQFLRAQAKAYKSLPRRPARDVLLTGRVGACGVRLYGLYAASRTLRCGALVSVRHDGRYVFVRILDRGPWGDYSRILDLSPRAFRILAPLSTGVIPARTVHIRKH